MCVNASDDGVRESRSVDLAPSKSAVRFEVRVELFERTCRDLIQRVFSELRNDLLVDALLVGDLRRLGKAVFAVSAVPEVHPLAEWHGR